MLFIPIVCCFICVFVGVAIDYFHRREESARLRDQLKVVNDKVERLVANAAFDESCVIDETKALNLADKHIEFLEGKEKWQSNQIRVLQEHLYIAGANILAWRLFQVHVEGTRGLAESFDDAHRGSFCAACGGGSASDQHQEGCAALAARKALKYLVEIQDALLLNGGVEQAIERLKEGTRGGVVADLSAESNEKILRAVRVLPTVVELDRLRNLIGVVRDSVSTVGEGIAIDILEEIAIAASEDHALRCGGVGVVS